MSKLLMARLKKVVKKGKPIEESQIKRGAKTVDPTEDARNKFIAKLDENIAVWNAIQAGEELPVHKLNTVDEKTGLKKTRKYAKWFKPNPNDGTFELAPRYGMKEIKNIFGEGMSIYGGLDESEVLPVLNALKESAEDKELDEMLLAARASATVKRKK